MAKSAAEKALDRLQEEDGGMPPALDPEIQPEMPPEPLLERSLIVAEFGTPEIAIAHFISATGFRELPQNLSYEDYEHLMGAVGTYKGALMWALGDLLIYGEDRWSDSYAQVADTTGYDPGTLEQAYSLCRAYPYETRHKDIGWTLHQAAKPLPPEQRDGWLQKAKEEGWARERLRDEIRKSQGREKQIGPGRPRKEAAPGETRPPKKPDEKAIKNLLENKLEPRLADIVKLCKGFLTEAEAMQDELELSGGTSTTTARKIAAAAKKLRDKADWLSKDLLSLERHAITVAEYTPPKKKVKKAESAAA